MNVYPCVCAFLSSNVARVVNVVLDGTLVLNGSSITAGVVVHHQSSKEVCASVTASMHACGCVWGEGGERETFASSQEWKGVKHFTPPPCPTHKSSVLVTSMFQRGTCTRKKQHFRIRNLFVLYSSALLTYVFCVCRCPPRKTRFVCRKQHARSA